MLEIANPGTDNSSSSNRLFEQIRMRILTGELAAGAKVTEAELAQRYGVNRAPLREALLRLEERRLIERVPFSGTRVFQPSTQMLYELYEVREVLEGLACRKVAEKITPDEIEELQRIVDESSIRLAQMDEEALKLLPAIRDIHTRIAEISGNQELQRILNGEIWHYLRGNHRRWVKSYDKRVVGGREHVRIVEAIRARDGELAEFLMRRHIRASRVAWEESLSGKEP